MSAFDFDVIGDVPPHKPMPPRPMPPKPMAPASGARPAAGRASPQPDRSPQRAQPREATGDRIDEREPRQG